MSDHWSQEEVALTVSDYLDMLADEVSQRQFSKAEHWRALMPKLQGRTKGAVEFKYGNVSAALLDLGYPFVDGYKPYVNYQHAVLAEVDAQLKARPDLVALIERDVTEPAALPDFRGILAALVERPELRVPPLPVSRGAQALRSSWAGPLDLSFGTGGL